MLEKILEDTTFYQLLKDCYFIYNDKDLIGKVRKQIIVETHNDEECVDEDCLTCIRKFKYQMKPQKDYAEEFKKLLTNLYKKHSMIPVDISIQYFDEIDFFPVVVKFLVDGDEEKINYRIVFYINHDHDNKYLIFSKNMTDCNLDMLMVNELKEDEKEKLEELKRELLN